jgi:hypothetical protein
MEPVRPTVDAWLLALLRERAFRKIDFGELPDGTIRLTIDLARELTATAHLWRQAVAPLAEKVAHTLLDAWKPGQRTPTALTGANRRAAAVRAREQTWAASERDGSAPRPPPVQDSSLVADRARRPGRAELKPKASIPRACPECGKPLPDGRRRFCSPECAEADFRAVRLAKLTRANHGGEAAKLRGQTNARKAGERLAWERAHPDVDLDAERARFAREIQPRLAGFVLARIMEATGVSLRYASQLRRGEVVPHPML